MTLYRRFVKNISFPIIAKRNGMSGLKDSLKRLEESQYWTTKKIEDVQIQKLRKLLIHAYNHTVFYKKRFDAVGFDPVRFNDFDDLKSIPVLTKDQIRDNLKDLMANHYDPSTLLGSETGGTTGVKMKFYLDKTCYAEKEASLLRFEMWAGWDIGQRYGLVWPARQDYVGHWTLKTKIKNELYTRQIVFPAAVLDDVSIEHYILQIIKKKPVMIRAFSTPIYEVAKYIMKNSYKDIVLNGVITTGEPLYDHQRQMISQAFHCDVFDSYRSREVGPLAQECERHDGMHINAESLYIETVPPEDADYFEDGIGDIVVTDLLNFGMPLIRYNMGDMGVLSGKKCPCGRGLPILKKVVGRTPDVFYTPDAKRIAAVTLVLYLVDEAPGLMGQVQIIQDKIDHLVIKMTENPVPTEEIKQYQVKTVKELFGENMRVSFEIVYSIPKESSGKYLFTKCLLSEKEIKNQCPGN